MTPATTKILFSIAPRACATLRDEFECGDGWAAILADFLRIVEPDGAELFCIKEKFGTMRISFENVPQPASRWAAALTEERSGITCEDCGAHGTRRGGGWLRTLCDECDGKWKAKRKAAGRE